MSLHLTDITLTYPDGDARLTALDCVDLHVEKGTMTAVIGPSGSGKSSLLAVAATLITPDSGRVVIDGTPTADMTRKELTTLRRNKIGTVFQQPNLLPSLTAVEQLQVIAHLDGHSPPRCRNIRTHPSRRCRARRSRAQEAASTLRWATTAGQYRPSLDERPCSTAGRRTHKRTRSRTRSSDSRCDSHLDPYQRHRDRGGHPRPRTSVRHGRSGGNRGREAARRLSVQLTWRAEGPCLPNLTQKCAGRRGAFGCRSGSAVLSNGIVRNSTNSESTTTLVDRAIVRDWLSTIRVRCRSS